MRPPIQMTLTFPPPMDRVRAMPSAPALVQARNPNLRWVSALRASIRIALARRRLAKMVEARRNSFEIADYRKRRSAALKHTRGLA